MSQTTCPHTVVDDFFRGATHSVQTFQLHHTDGARCKYRKRSILGSLVPIYSIARASPVLWEKTAGLILAKIAHEVDGCKGTSK
jgi:hypothetical protein